MYSRELGKLSDVPYAEPTWLSVGYYSPYFKEVNCTANIYGFNAHDNQNRVIDAYKQRCECLWMKLSLQMHW
jgi:hypothetical protein